MPKQYKLKAETGKFHLKGGNLNLGVKRGEVSWAYFVLAYNISLTISIGLITVFETTSLNKIILIILMSYILYRCCFFKNWCRNKIVVIFSKSKEYVEKY